MQVTIGFSFDQDPDGYNGSAHFVREDVEDLYQLAQFLTQAVQGAGFTYVTDVGFDKGNGNVVWGEGEFIIDTDDF